MNKLPAGDKHLVISGMGGHLAESHDHDHRIEFRSKAAVVVDNKAQAVEIIGVQRLTHAPPMATCAC